MYGDYSRNPEPSGDFVSAVLFNQGQPIIEADLNESLTLTNARVTRIVHSLMNVMTVKGTRMKVPTSIRTGWKLFRPSGGSRVALRAGTMLFASFEISTSEKLLLNKFKKLGSTGSNYYVDRNDNSDSVGSDPIDPGQYVVTLVAYERHLLQSEVEERSPISTSNFMKIDWRVELYKTADSAADAEEIRFKNRFDAAPLLNVNGFNAKKFRGQILRLELHSDDGAGNYEFKLGVDNAPFFRASEVVGPTVQLSYFGAESELPQQNEFVEVERRVSWSLGANRISQVKTRNGRTLELLDSLTEFTPSTDQLRRWNWKTPPTLNISGAPASIAFTLGSLSFQITETSGPPLKDRLRAGDYWLFTGDGKVVGQRRHEYSAPLGVVNLLGNGDINSIDGDLRGSMLLASSYEGPKIVSEIASNSPATRGSETSKVLSDLQVLQLCGDVGSKEIRRWLASMTFSEIVGLSSHEIRKRIQRDLRLNDAELDACSNDLDRIESKRIRMQELCSIFA